MDTFGPFNSLDQVVQFWTFVFGLWAFCTVVCIGLASWKARNPVLWGLLGLLFGPFALLVLIFKPNVSNNAAPNKGDSAKPGPARGNR